MILNTHSRQYKEWIMIRVVATSDDQWFAGQLESSEILRTMLPSNFKCLYCKGKKINATSGKVFNGVCNLTHLLYLRVT